MSDEEKPVERKARRRWKLAVVPLMLYVLSTGPISWIAGRYYNSVPEGIFIALRIVYAPLYWLADVAPWFKDAWKWYLRLL